MPQFLNTQSFYEELLKMINECEHELVIIVPYIKMTSEIFEAFINANSRGVETTLVYREKKVTKIELDKLYELDNMNILHHPNVHCKMYYDGTNAIIGSLNLYDYSIANNREMGVLFRKNELGNNGVPFFKNGKRNANENEFLKEIQDIFNGSVVEKKSKDTLKGGFNIDIAKTRDHEILDDCDSLTAFFVNKKFTPYNVEYKDVVFPACINYFDRIDVIWEYKRMSLKINKEKNLVEEIFQQWDLKKLKIRDNIFYDLYLNDRDHHITIYISTDTEESKELKYGSYSEQLPYYQKALNLIIQEYRRITKV